MKIVLYTVIKFANKTVTDYLLFVDNNKKIHTTPDKNNAKKFSSYYEASNYLKGIEHNFNVEELK